MHINKDQVAELQDLLGEDFGMFLETFLADMVARCDIMVSALQAQDQDALRQAAHSLKGSTSNLGADALSDLCAQVESAALAADFSTSDQLLQAVLAEKDMVVQDIQSLA